MSTGSNLSSRPALRSVSQITAPKAKTVATISLTRPYRSALSTLASALRMKTSSSFFMVASCDKLTDSCDPVGKPGFCGSQGDIENSRRLFQREMLLVVKQEHGPACRGYTIHQPQKIGIERLLPIWACACHRANQFGIIFEFAPTLRLLQRSKRSARRSTERPSPEDFRLQQMPNLPVDLKRHVLQNIVCLRFADKVDYILADRTVHFSQQLPKGGQVTRTELA